MILIILGVLGWAAYYAVCCPPKHTHWASHKICFIGRTRDIVLLAGEEGQGGVGGYFGDAWGYYIFWIYDGMTFLFAASLDFYLYRVMINLIPVDLV
jgi:hypothetical protein